MSSAPGTAVTRLAGIVGEANFSADPATLALFEANGAQPRAVVRPGTSDEVAEVVRCAAAENMALVPCGAKTKLRNLRPRPEYLYDIVVDMTRMNGVIAYDPGDLTLSVQAGIGIGALLDTLAEKKQTLPLLVPWLDRATVGGILASNSISPLRYMFGGPRDFILGMQFVTGEGQLCKSGTRVVKSVAGYDLHKLLLGACGELGIITAVNFRTFPVPRAQQSFVVSYQSLRDAHSFCARIAESPLKPAVVEVLDPGAAKILGSDKLPSGRWCVVVAAVGHESVVDRHRHDLALLAEQTRALEFQPLEDADKRKLLGSIREFLRLVGEKHPEAIVLRVAVLPGNVSATWEQLRNLASQNGLDSAFVVRAATTLYTVLQPTRRDALSSFGQILRAVMDPASRFGCLQMEQRPQGDPFRRWPRYWGPEPPGVELMKRVKQVFDPQGVFG